MCTKVVGQIRDSTGELVPIRVLLDTGTTSTILLKKFVSPKMRKYRVNAKKSMTWNTLGGSFKTRHVSDVRFRLPEFSSHRTIDWRVHVDEHTDPDLARYDMIIGTDLLKELKMELSFKDNTMTWEEATISMKDYGTLSSRETTTHPQPIIHQC